MIEYGLDVAARQIVHWLKDEQASGNINRLAVRATREYTAEPVSDLDEAGIGEDQDVAVLTTVGTLEVQPREAAHHWVLRVRIGDVVGSHLPEDESVPEDPEEIDLETFNTEFVAPDRGTVYVSVSAATPEAKEEFDRLLPEIITDRHGR